VTEPAGEPFAEHLARELADLTATDGTVWTYHAESGGYCSADHPGVICRDAASVAAHTGGDDGIVYQRRDQP
jgi:hypothetical protein